MAIKVVDFFCGCGGTNAGLQKSDMEIVAGFDIDKSALATFKYNVSKAEVFSQSICDLDPSDLANVGKRSQNTKLLFAACAPCQPFSTQNRMKSSDDSRISLLTEFHRFVEYFMPDYIILENVPGIQRVEDGPFAGFEKFLQTKE